MNEGEKNDDSGQKLDLREALLAEHKSLVKQLILKQSEVDMVKGGVQVVENLLLRLKTPVEPDANAK